MNVFATLWPTNATQQRSNLQQQRISELAVSQENKSYLIYGISKPNIESNLENLGIRFYILVKYEAVSGWFNFA